MKKVNREHIMNTTTPDERSEKDGLAREPRELSSEELESIIGGSEVGIGIGRSGIFGNIIPLKGYAGAVAVTDPDE
jgi:hypothetical protein